MRSTLVGVLGFGVVMVACATSSSPNDDALPATASASAPSLPPPGSGVETPTATTSSSSSSSSSSSGGPGDAGTKKDASTPPPPPPPQICINEAGAPLAVQTPCGCDKDCATSLVCDVVGGLLEPWCCVPAKGPCVDANDCCGQMLCIAGDGGKSTCQ